MVYNNSKNIMIMRKLFFYSMMTAIMTMAAFIFSACGGDDKDDIPDGYVKTTEGVHRTEVSFSGNTAGWSTSLTFIAVYGDGTHGKVKMYENGKQISDNGGFSSEEMRSYAVDTDAMCDMMSTTIILTHESFGSVEPITVTLKGYVNGKQTNMKVVEISASETYKGIIFSAEDIGADLVK